MRRDCAGTSTNGTRMFLDSLIEFPVSERVALVPVGPEPALQLQRHDHLPDVVLVHRGNQA